MHCFIYPQQDATIYNDYTLQNTGKDEILEISKLIISSSDFATPYYSRALIKFNINWISQSIQDNIIGSTKFYLNLKLSWATELVNDPQYLYIYPISQSWVEGIGKRLTTTEKTTGVNWVHRDSEITSSWYQSGSDYISSSLYVVTASMYDNNNSFQENGTYVYELSDIRADVTDIVHSWLSSSIENNGFIIKMSDSDELDDKNRGKILFYSMDSHTINIPNLEVAWDDYSYNTGSLIVSQLEDTVVYIKNLKNQYNNRSKTRFRLNSRNAYPTKSYSTTNQYFTNNCLPSQSYYSLVDNSTNETLIPFGEFSKISCDNNGNFFDLMFDGLFPERQYKIKIKSISGSIEQYYDNNNIFKVIK